MAGDGTGRRRGWAAAASSLAAAAGLVAAWRVLAGDLRLGGVVVALGGLGLAAGRALAEGDLRSRLFASLADRVVEGAVLAAVAWWAREREPAAAAGALVALGGMAIAAYIRARGEALGYRMGEASATRAVLLGWLAVVLLAGWERWGLVGLGAATVAVAGARVRRVVRQERR